MPIIESEPKSALELGADSVRREFSLGHPLVWLGLTIIMLAGGYLWLSTSTKTNISSEGVVPVRKLTPENSHSVDDNKGSVIEKTQVMSITKDNDEDRAKIYLQHEALEQKILPLLDAADVLFENQNFVMPAGNNAWEKYQAILAIDPSESIAISGLTKVKSKLIGNAEEAIDSGELEDAENWLVQLDIVQPDHPMQQDFRNEIEQLIAEEAAAKLREQEVEATRQKINRSLSQANAELNSSNINFNKAKDLFERVFDHDPDNKEAKTGLTQLADKKLDQVEEWLVAEKLDDARLGLEDAKQIDAKNKRISSIHLALVTSLKQQKLEQERLEERKRLAEEAKRKKLEAEQAQAAANASATANNNPTSTEPVGIAKIQPLLTTPLPTTDTGEEKRLAAQRESLRTGIRAYYRGDYVRSFEVLFPLAQEGITRAQFRIGIMYHFGRSVPVNRDLAEKWFTKALPQLLRAAQQGVAWAQADLGTTYEFGISLQQDFNRAAYWYEQAATQGYAGAQTNLGVLYAQGDGVPYDRSKAVFWLRKSAAQGDKVAKDNLRILGVITQ